MGPRALEKPLTAVPAALIILAVGLLVACGGSQALDVSGKAVRTGDTFERDSVTQTYLLTVKGTSNWDVTGALVGTNVIKYSMPSHLTTGELSMDYISTFTGTIGDKSGTITAHGVGTGKRMSQTDASYTAEETITGGTGDFTGITGTMHTVCNMTSERAQTTYEGTLQYK